MIQLQLNDYPLYVEKDTDANGISYKVSYDSGDISFSYTADEGYLESFTLQDFAWDDVELGMEAVWESVEIIKDYFKK